MTVSKLFREVGLVPSGPVAWGREVFAPKHGVYVIARVDDPEAECDACSLLFNDQVTNGIDIAMEYEMRRWISDEAVLYIGKTDRPIQTRLREFFRHQCGRSSPHAGGQVIKLLRCDLWAYWSESAKPYETELAMLCAFRKQAGRLPYGNKDVDREKRIRRQNSNLSSKISS